MHPLEKETLKVIRLEHLLEPGEKVLIGVSGGPDSMALVHVLARLAPDLNITLAAAYVNHGLRPDDTPGEKTLVKNAAKDLGVDFFTEKVDVRDLAAKKKISIEHGARLLRYDFFEKTAAAWNAAKIAVAHTADDQAEEILLRLIRGTARKGLSGMQTIRDGRIIRPFLRIPKTHLLEYLEQYSIPYLLDSTNMENIYLRNRIRNDLLPYLTEHYNPDIRTTLLRTANILQDEEVLLDNFTESAFTKTVFCKTPDPTKEKTSLTVASPEREIIINLKYFKEEPRAIQRRLLEKCCWEMNCNPLSRQIELLLQLAMKDSPGGGLHLADGLRVTKKEGHLCFTYPRGKGPLRGDISSETVIEFPATSIPGPGIYEFPQLGKKLLVEESNKNLSFARDALPDCEFLDSLLFSFPLTLRGPKQGDRFHPLGAPGSKKVYDFLSDQKIALHLRGRVPVLCDDDSIIAIPGLRIDHRYRVTEKTIRVIRLCWDDIGWTDGVSNE